MTKLEKLALRATKWIGSPSSLIIHTVLFILFFVLYFFDYSLEKILLTLTTIVSLEAIYLSIFIQISVNSQKVHMKKIVENLEDIQEDIEDLQEEENNI